MADGGAPKHPLSEMLTSVHDQLRRIEETMEKEAAGARSIGTELAPVWREVTEGEHRLPVAAAVAAAIALQLVLPQHLVIHPAWLLPVLEGALLVGLVAANPMRINRTNRWLRGASVALIALISLANGWSSAKLINGIVSGTSGDNASLLLSRGASVYITNIIVFALWYWEWDGGGPVARARGSRPYPDFLFPQMTQASVAPPTWRPSFIDYLYVSFTNASAFSPTDTMPLSRWAKMLMLVQSSIALLTVAFVIARAINVLK